MLPAAPSSAQLPSWPSAPPSPRNPSATRSRSGSTELGLEHRVEFAPYNQVFQQLLDPASLLAQNRAGFDVLLVRLEDWAKGGGLAHLEEIVPQFLTGLREAAAAWHVPTLVVICPCSPAFLASGRGARGSRASDVQRHAKRSRRSAACTWSRPTSWTCSIRCPTATTRTPTSSATCPTRRSCSRRSARSWRGGSPRSAVRRTRSSCSTATRRSGRASAPRTGPAASRSTPSAARCRSSCAPSARRGCCSPCAARTSRRTCWTCSARTRSCRCASRTSPRSASTGSRSPQNLASLAQELGLGLDSFVFVDDNEAECAEVEASCPEVLTLALPQQDVAAFLRHVWAFDRPRHDPRGP